MAEGGTKAKGCIKLRRCTKYKTHYKVQFTRTEVNKARRIIRHLRSHPDDLQARERYGAERAAKIAPNSKGRKHERRARAAKGVSGRATGAGADAGGSSTSSSASA